MLNQYKPFLNELLERIKSSRYNMLKTVSKETVLLYWDIGQKVSLKTKEEGWGKAIVERLSQDLQLEFPGVRGFSSRNIWNMKNFYEFYSINQKLQPLVAEIGWVQNCKILEKCKDLNQIEFYLRKTKQMGWSKSDLIDKINLNYYENQALAQHNFDKTIPQELRAQVAWEFIDDYQVELINPDLPFSEKELENSIVSNIVNFLGEMGGHFGFVGRQYRIEFHEKEYFIDLLFFNMKLNCYVVFELKSRGFEPRDLGQVKWYMELINNQIKDKHHNATIGIVLCKEKDRLMVEYMLSNNNDPLAVSTINQYKNLPEEYAKYLPSEEEIVKRLLSIDNSNSELI